MTINPTIPTVGSPRGSEEIDIVNALTAIVDAVNKGTGPALVASLPLAPVDGQEVYYLADATNGIVWHLKYRAASASAYKWEFVGGSALSSEVEIDQTIASAVYGDLATVGPSVTLPLAGDYDVVHGFEGWANTTGAQISMSYAIGATAAAEADSISTGFPTVAAGALAAGRRERRKAGLAAGTALVSKYRSSTGTGTFRRRVMAVRPVRVG
jgi:hypothetical protein